MGFEVLNIAADGAHVAGQELGEVFLGEQAALFPGFLDQAGQLVPAEAVGAAGGFLILALNEGEDDAELAALGQRLACALGGAPAVVAKLAALGGRGARLGEIDFVDGSTTTRASHGLRPVPWTTSVTRRWSWVLVASRRSCASFLSAVVSIMVSGFGLRVRCADSLAVRTRSRHPLPFVSLKATGQMLGS
jgi:hypothetical protein